MIVTICRSSVAMGDDVYAPHEIEVEIEEEASYEQLFDQLLSMSYLPFVHGNDVVWVLRNNGRDLLAYYTKKGCKISLEPNRSLKEKEKDYFVRYYTSPDERIKVHDDLAELETEK